MKEYILNLLVKEHSSITITFNNGKSHSFNKVVNNYIDNPNLIELKSSETQYSALLRLDQITYVSHRN